MKTAQSRFQVYGWPKRPPQYVKECSGAGCCCTVSLTMRYCSHLCVTTSKPTNQGRSVSIEGTAERGILRLLPAMARIAVVVGAFGSLALMLRAGRNTPRVLLVLFAIWILSPYVGLAWANMVSLRWAVVTRATLHVVTLVIALGAPAIYAAAILLSQGPPRGNFFVLVPPVSVLLMMTVVPTASLISRRSSRRDPDVGR